MKRYLVAVSIGIIFAFYSGCKTYQTIVTNTSGGGNSNALEWVAVNSPVASNGINMIIDQLFVDSHDRLYAVSVSGYSIGSSSDGGMTWSAADSIPTPPRPYYSNYFQIYIAPNEDLYLCIYFIPSTAGGITLQYNDSTLLFRSTNFGGSWFAVTNPAGKKGAIPNIVFDNAGNMFAGTSGGVFKSVDNAATWTPLNSGFASDSVASLAIGPGNVLYAGVIDEGIYRSNNEGAAWTPVNSGLPSAQNETYIITPISSLPSGIGPLILGVDNSDKVYVSIVGNNFFIGNSNNHFYVSSSQGQQWTFIDSGIPNTESIVNMLIVDSTDMYCQGASRNNYYSDNGINWYVMPQDAYAPHMPNAVDSKKYLYAIGMDIILKSATPAP